MRANQYDIVKLKDGSLVAILEKRDVDGLEHYITDKETDEGEFAWETITENDIVEIAYKEGETANK